MDVERDTALVEPGETYESITDRISSIVLQRTPWSWYLAIGFSLLMMLPYPLVVALLLLDGTGIWGINMPVAWGFAIVNFVWWIGIGHAGTFISAILLLLHARWRTSINRFAEAMTLFAVLNALMLPLLHLGRPWLFYYMLPYPNSMGVWPQFRSPLLWDMVAVLTYFLISLLFWYMGLIPDLATLRDRAGGGLRRAIYGALSLGWVGSAHDWDRYEKAYYLIAALLVPLVISEHSIVGMDFAYSVIPGWHETIVPPLFLVGAFFSGFAMLLVLAVLLRGLYGLKDYITIAHLDNLGKLLLVTSLLFLLGYITIFFGSWYRPGVFAEHALRLQVTSPLFWGMVAGVVLVPQLLWWERIRRDPLALFLVGLVALAGIWLDRYNFVTSNLEQDFLPSAWGSFSPTLWDWSLFVGSIGLFLTLLFLFIRFVPVISIYEMRELISEHGVETEAHK